MGLPETEDLVDYRKKFFIYRMTVNQGYTRWFYLSVDFSIVHSPRKVIAEYELTDWQGTSRTIRAEGELIDDRFICIFRDLSTEELCCVYLFPHFRTAHNELRCGICLHQTWDQDAPDCLSRAIINDVPVLGWEKDGIVDQKTGSALDDLWETKFAATHLILERSLEKIL